MRFLIVGGLNTAAAYGFYAACVAIGLHHQAALGVSWVLSTTFNFFSYGHLVFRNGDLRLVFRFFACYLLVLVVNATCLEVLVRLEAGPYLGQMLAIPLVAGTAYALQRFLVFGPSPASGVDRTPSPRAG